MTIPNPADSPELELRRFLYLNTSSNAFLTGDPEVHRRFSRDNLRCLDELLKSDPAKVCRIVAAVEGENAVPRRESLFFVMAAALTSKVPITDAYRRELYTTLLNICKSDTDMFSFVKYASKFKKTFSSGMNKVVARFYKNKEPMELVRNVCKRKGYHTWTHKDLIKMSHLKVESDLLQIAILFTMNGLKEAEEFALEKNEGQDMIAYIKSNVGFKSTANEEEALAYITEHKIDYDQLPMQLRKSHKIIEAVLQYTDMRSLLNILLKLYRSGLLKHDSKLLQPICNTLTTSDNVKASGVQPIDVFLALRYFEKGGKPRDPCLIAYLEEREKQEKKAQNITEFTKTNYSLVEPVKCPQMISALNKCLLLSYHNVVSTNRRFLITVEVSEHMDKPCMTSKNLSGYEAAVIEILTYLKSEKNVVVGVFNGPIITQVTIDKGGSVAQAIKKLKDSEHGEVQMGAPIEWARKNKKAIDMFINILHTPIHMNFTLKDKPLLNPIDAYTKYKAAMNMSSTKLVLHNLHQPATTCFKENSLDIRGFDANVPKVIDAYIKNLV